MSAPSPPALWLCLLLVLSAADSFLGGAECTGDSLLECLRDEELPLLLLEDFFAFWSDDRLLDRKRGIIWECLFKLYSL